MGRFIVSVRHNSNGQSPCWSMLAAKPQFFNVMREMGEGVGCTYKNRTEALYKHSERVSASAFFDSSSAETRGKSSIVTSQ